MPLPHTWASRLASAATLMLALALVSQVGRGTSASGYVEHLSVGVAVMAVLAAAKMCRHNCFESRLVATLLALATVAGVALVASVGLPGTSSATLSAHHGVLLGLASAVLVLLAVDRNVRRHGLGTSAPYAR